MSHDIGSIVEGTVVDIVKFGAFIKIKDGKTGLVHISQISDKFVREVSDHVTIGTHIVAKIISIDEKGRIQLSLKNISPEEIEKFQSEAKPEPRQQRQQPQHDMTRPQERREHYQQQYHDSGGGEGDSFEKKFKRFLRQSEDRQVDLKRNLDAKRGFKKRKK